MIVKALCLWYEGASITVNKMQTGSQGQWCGGGHCGLASLEPVPGTAALGTGPRAGLPLHFQRQVLFSQVTLQGLNAVPVSVPGVGLALSPALTWCALGKG